MSVQLSEQFSIPKQEPNDNATVAGVGISSGGHIKIHNNNNNKQRLQLPKNLASIANDTDELRHAKVPLDLSKIIANGRLAKGLSQRNLATRINEKVQVISDYENGRAIPNTKILAKIEKIIGIKLLGKDRGAVLPTATAQGKKNTIEDGGVATKENNSNNNNNNKSNYNNFKSFKPKQRK